MTRHDAAIIGTFKMYLCACSEGSKCICVRVLKGDDHVTAVYVNSIRLGVP